MLLLDNVWKCDKIVRIVDNSTIAGCILLIMLYYQQYTS
jgi:hypothetical protein